MQLARAGGGAAGDRAELILALDALEFGEGGEGLEIGALPVAFGREVAVRFDQGGELLDGDDFFVGADRLEEALEVDPFPSRAGFQHAVIKIEAIHVNEAAPFRHRRGSGWWLGRVGHSSSGKSLLIYAGEGGIYQLTSRINCDGVIRKGCLDFFCTGLAGGVPSLAWGCRARRGRAAATLR